MRESYQKDFELAQAALGGDEAAFERIVTENRDRIKSVVRRYLRAFQPDVPEIMQEIWMQVWIKLKQFKGDAMLSTWIFTIARNQCLMHLRSKKWLRNRHEETNIDALNDHLRQLGSAKDKTRILDRIALEKAINELPAGYKKYFVLVAVCGFEKTEAARYASASEGTAKSQYFKAVRALRKILNRKTNPRARNAHEKNYV
jgi:RNA polymerase sigma-70 factor, ECF subfamily